MRKHSDSKTPYFTEQNILVPPVRSTDLQTSDPGNQDWKPSTTARSGCKAGDYEHEISRANKSKSFDFRTESVNDVG